MALERKWLAVSATPFIADGTSIGIITISDTAGFYTKSKVQLSSNTLQPISLQVQQVLSPTQLVVGPVGPKVGREHFQDVSAYTVADNASIAAPEQDKSNIPDKDHYVAVYEADPIVADRVISVDKHGKFYDQNNPLPTTLVDSGSGGLAPKNYDDIKIIKNSNGDPIQYQYYLASVSVGNINVYYDIFGASEYKKA